MLTEEVESFAPLSERRTIPGPTYGYTPCWGVLQPSDYPQEWIEGLHSRIYTDIPWYDQWKRGVKGLQPVLSPSYVEAESSRAAAHRQALESPLAP